MVLVRNLRLYRGSNIGRGELFRIVYVHVPATWAALLLYAVIVCCAVAQMLAGARLASMLLEAVAPTAAVARAEAAARP